MTLDANTPIDSPELLAHAKALLRERHPTLTDHDIELLAGNEAQRIYDDLRREGPYVGP